MTPVRPKMANIFAEEDFGKWLAQTIQDKIAKENAGFVQVELHPRGYDRDAREPKEPKIVLRGTDTQHEFTLNYSVRRVSG